MSASNNFVKVTGTAVEATAAASGGAFALAVTKQWLDMGAVAAGVILTLVMIVYWSFKIYATIVNTRVEKSRQKRIDEISGYVLTSQLEPDAALKILKDLGGKNED